MNQPDGRSTLVSVIIPTHNRADMLPRAVQSVLAQTYPHLEIIIVDDASSDTTRDVVRAMSDDRIRYIRHETSRGGSVARNSGVRRASGDYIAFLDDDDEWEAQKIELQIAAIEEQDVVMCTASINGKDTAQRRPRPFVDAAILRRRMFPYGGIGVLLARAQVLREIPFDETLPKCQDWDLVIRIAAKHRIVYLNKSLVRFNDGGHQRISNQLVNLAAHGIARKYGKFFEKHRDFFGDRWVKFHLASMLMYGIKHRDAKFRHLCDAIDLCGPVAVSRVLAKRIRQGVTERIPRRAIARRDAREQAVARAAS